MIREYSIPERVEPPQRARTIRQLCMRSRAEWSPARAVRQPRQPLEGLPHLVAAIQIRVSTTTQM